MHAHDVRGRGAGALAFDHAFVNQAAGAFDGFSRLHAHGGQQSAACKQGKT